MYRSVNVSVRTPSRYNSENHCGPFTIRWLDKQAIRGKDSVNKSFSGGISQFASYFMILSTLKWYVALMVRNARSTSVCFSLPVSAPVNTVLVEICAWYSLDFQSNQCGHHTWVEQD